MPKIEKTAPKEIPSPTSPNSRHYTSLDCRNCLIITRSGLCPNGFWGVPGNSNWDSATLTFPEFFIWGLRQFASTRFHCTLRLWAPGSVLTTSPKILAFRAILKTHFAMARTLSEIAPLNTCPPAMGRKAILQFIIFYGVGREENQTKPIRTKNLNQIKIQKTNKSKMGKSGKARKNPDNTHTIGAWQNEGTSPCC